MVKRSKNSRKNEEDYPTEFLTLEQILVIHEDQIDLYGGRQGIRDLALLESSVFRPHSSFGGKDLYLTLFDKAAALMHSLILNYPFVDGNKRTGIVAAIVILELNGYKIKVKPEDVVSVALKVESKEFKLELISQWLKKNSIRFNSS